MRTDSCGIFWIDTPKVVEKHEPPEPTWLRPDYLPYFEDAKAFNVSLFTTDELVAAYLNREILICDIEIYLNYFLCAFTSLSSGKVYYFETSTSLDQHEREQLSWILHSFKIVTFNGNYFDIPILALAIAGFSTEQLKHASSKIINEEIKPWLVLRSHKVESLKINHIDLIEVAPLSASLKIYGGRLHVPKMQELPFKHDTILTEDQKTVVRWYCINSDLTATAFLYMELAPQIKLRESMSVRYNTDLRSKSDAQIAEAVIVSELSRLNICAERTEIPAGTAFQYQVPDYVSFKSDELKQMLETIRNASFVIQENGSPHTPKEISELKVSIAGKVYQMGIGGLHSCETCVSHFTDSEHVLFDRDVASYYPSIILNQKLFPKHLGPPFLQVYQTLVDRRLAAKKSGDKVVADTLKITINGSFGKFGNKYSVLYAPDLMLQVTISGQLSLLMLIEWLELAGISVVSANTDGVLIRCRRDMIGTMNMVVTAWEARTQFKTEETPYSAFYARDVNNYLAVKTDGKSKVKGCYAERGSAGDSVLSKNPVNLICLDALVAFLTTGASISHTIRSCRDIRRFVSVRTVKGGAVKDGQYLGKAIRWYQSTKVTGEIIYAINGNKVPNSENCRPCMELPVTFPDDIDFARYEQQTFEMLKEIGFK